jgi:hypothetical protein
MAIAITVTRSLQADGILVSAFCKQSIAFTATGLTTGDYSELLIDGLYAFRCTEVSAGSFLIDCDMLSAFLGLSPNTITITGLIRSTDFQIVFKNSAGVAYGGSGTVAVDTDTLLCFGYPKRGASGGMATVLSAGYSRQIYHNGRYCKFVTSAYVITSTTTSTTGITYVAPDANHKEIAWIDNDGKWSFWNFRYLSKEVDNKKSNSVPYYAVTNALQIMSSYDISAESVLRLNFDTVAVNTEHYEQLCDISASPRVIYDSRVYRVVSSNKQTADCRQNLKFNLTLEIEENAVSY